MRIEIAEPGRMSQSGSSLLRLIQNNKTPVLDLLVRESVQNSLDAHKEDAKAVIESYLNTAKEFELDRIDKAKELEVERMKIETETAGKFYENICKNSSLFTL